MTGLQSGRSQHGYVAFLECHRFAVVLVATDSFRAIATMTGWRMRNRISCALTPEASRMSCAIWQWMSGAEMGTDTTQPSPPVNPKTMKRRETFLPFTLPEVGKAELDAVADVIASGWLTTGPKAKLFEEQFARYVGAKFAVAVNSCTAAMHLSLEASGVAAGDFVITTPYTFAATAEVIRYFDAIPVFVDVEPDTLNLDPKRLAETIQELQSCLFDGRRPESPAVVRALGDSRRLGTTTRNELRAGRPPLVKAVIPVHLAGHPCDMDAIAAIANQHHLAILEDAAHACSASYKGRPIGSAMAPDIPWAASFSFYATKTLATGEGGMITTDSAEWADRLRIMSLHGISKDAWKRYTAEGNWYYEITAPGYKYNMPDLMAAIGLAQLTKVDNMRQRREEIARQYNEAFAPYGGSGDSDRASLRRTRMAPLYAASERRRARARSRRLHCAPQGAEYQLQCPFHSAPHSSVLPIDLRL